MPPVAVILKGYPRLSETFIAEEIHALERAGLQLAIYSLRHPTDEKTHAVHHAIRAPVTYLPEYLHNEPLRVLRAWRRMRHTPAYKTARRTWWQDFRRDVSRNRLRRFGQALVLAAELSPDINFLYAHFLHTPASVARYAALLLRMPWAVSAHAKDIWTSPEWEVREKLASCRWLTTCTRAGFEHLQTIADEADKVSLNYHGLNLALFPSPPPRQNNNAGGDAANPVRILSVGRAVAKKGYRGLLDALAALPAELHWEFHHIGGGPLLPECKRHATQLGIAARVHWHGAQSREQVIAHYAAADFFALNCCIAADGDRDGLPNVIVEAQSQGLAVLSTKVSGVPELVRDEVNGLLVDAGDGESLAAALHRLIIEPALRRRLGDAGSAIVRAEFDQAKNFTPLLRLLTPP